MSRDRNDVLLRAGDRVWMHDANESVIIAVVDDDSAQLSPEGDPERWIACAACTRQSETATEIATLTKWARSSGRRGMVARRVLAIKWSDGELTR